MSIFKDGENVYDISWYSSPWKPYYNKLTSRTIGEDSGDDTTIKVWCGEEDLEGKVFTLTVANLGSADALTSVTYPLSAGGTATEADNYNVNNATSHDDKPAKWWYGPGVALQFPDGTHATTTYTQTTVYTHTISASDIGERVYDGGIHCWMKLPHAPRGGGIAAQTDFYSKNIPMEYINNADFLLVFNSYGHQPLRQVGSTGNAGLSLFMQNSDVLNATEDDEFETMGVALMDDVDITVALLLGGVQSYTYAEVVTGSGLHGRKKAKSMRFLWFTEDGLGSESTFHGGQFIRVSIYPLRSNIK